MGVYVNLWVSIRAYGPLREPVDLCESYGPLRQATAKRIPVAQQSHLSRVVT